MKLNEQEQLMQTGLDLGADFAEVFIETSQKSSLTYKDQKVESATGGTDHGIGLRLIRQNEVAYVWSSHNDLDPLLHLTRQLQALDWSKPTSRPTVDQSTTSTQLKRVAQHSQMKERLEWLKIGDQKARQCSSKIKQVSASAVEETQFVSIYNSEGLYREGRRDHSRFSIQATASEGDLLFTGRESPGAALNTSFFQSLDIEDLAQQAAERALLMLDATYIQAGPMPVVIGPHFGGVIFHEACGHPLETESVRKKASPFTDQLGQPIAHEKVTAIDDGTLPGVWGSLEFDDEGMETEKTVLIEKGILKHYLSDRIGAQEVGVRRTGSARRESYRYAPVARMRNTYIEKGEDSFEEMIQSIDHGLYAKVMGGGSVNPATGEFNFSVQEGYRIEKGKISEPVRGATLIGHGHKILPKISMVGKDLEMSTGMCGASSGHVPVTVGQPSLKVDEILVGGRS